MTNSDGTIPHQWYQLGASVVKQNRFFLILTIKSTIKNLVYPHIKQRLWLIIGVSFLRSQRLSS